ncbi:GNAT family N-acetyltransferase [Azospirillum sp. TSO22-1]|uniref:GNAT family N-acetyltransferase n=1 Tax=Azospirillum sp. TSO22-1 TaxID=716789 RepID=UPI000D603723|nr:GNAT family N-acetyltransferase [Azospirillum sp. TSO22-1]PWC56146.1 GCN5 family acetyltransferase [Azospirillum sp. TSO22-1]
MAGGDRAVRVATADEVALIVDWAAAEGWNPGTGDAACFRTQDPAGFFVGIEDGAPVSAVSVVNYGDALAFLGLYIVRPDRRGRGWGMATWRAGLAHAGARPVGLDGVVAQQDNYRKSGFVLAHRNIRYGGTVAPGRHDPAVVPVAEVPFADLAAYDSRCFPAERPAFLRAWTTAPGHHALALLRGGRLAGYGVARPCREGHKIGPLFADDRPAAETLFDALTAAAGGGPVFLDVPEPNAAAVDLARSRALAPVFETARMYTAPVRPVADGRVFGITTFELG